MCTLMKSNSSLDFRDPFTTVAEYSINDKLDDSKEEETATFVSGDTESNQESLHFINQKGRSSKFDQSKLSSWI